MGFNPCCGGSVASTARCPRLRPEASRCFNPCCGGSVASTRTGGMDRPRVRRFQSLLWWIGRVNSDAPWTTRCGPDVGFNPCCGGLVASTPCDRRAACKLMAVSILVVVDWSRQHGRRSVSNDILAAFQSLLWWIGRVNRIGRGRQSPAPARFQSLLWWIGRVNTITVGICDRAGRPSFNPCCGGLVASTSRFGRPVPTHVRVSILVVVDWSRQRGYPGRDPSHEAIAVSILVVVDRSRQLDRPPDDRCRRQVSILVVVDWSRQRG